jgi:hypothetical protein
LVLVVSLDSECLSWLDEQIDTGELPNLAHLQRAGRRLPLEAVRLAGTAYPTLYSGQSAATHGFHFPVQWSAELQTVRPWSHWEYPASVVERADRAGARIVMLDPPECPPLHLEHGWAASGIQFRSRVLLHSWSSNNAAGQRLMRRMGWGPRADEVFGQPTIAGLSRLRQALIGAPERLRQTARAVLADDSPDCLWLNCCAMHVAGHQFFDLRLVDDSAGRRALESVRLEVARGYDTMLGDLMGALPPGSDALVFYAKGMGPVRGWVDLLPTMLSRVLGERSRVEAPVAGMRRLIPQWLRSAVAGRMSDAAVAEWMARLSTPRVDWRETRAFTVPSDEPGFIRLNLQGREREGIVPESQRAALSAEIREGLSSFQTESGRLCIENICTPEDLYDNGPALDLLPDLVVFWSDEPTLLGGAIQSPRFGEIRRERVSLGRSGNHGPGAMAITSAARDLPTFPDRLVRPQDIPVTLLAALGLPHDDLPGRPLLRSVC